VSGRIMIFNIEECTCDCHNEYGIRVEHCMPCCLKCPECGMNVLEYWYDRHVEKHKIKGGYLIAHCDDEEMVTEELCKLIEENGDEYSINENMVFTEVNIKEKNGK
jgi:hypothetical protein